MTPLTARAAVFDGTRLRVVDDLLVRAPGPGEVTVRVSASGVCHSDLNVVDRPDGVAVPVVLGHEACGVVEDVGPGVVSVVPGQPVVVASSVPCGTCRACRTGRPGACRNAFAPGVPPFTWQDAPVRAYANVASFATRTTVRERQLVPAEGIAPAAAALVGCAVSTGYGVVHHVIGVQPGDTVVVLGVGGIGVNVLQCARLAGAVRVVAVDVNAAKEETARRFGADTVVVVPRDADGREIAARVRAAVDDPIDATVECSGSAAAIAAAALLPGWGGTTALVGIPPPGTDVRVDVEALLRNRVVAGSLNGWTDAAEDFPAILDLARAGRLELGAQVSRVWPLDDVDDAIAAVRAGTVVRAVLDLTG